VIASVPEDIDDDDDEDYLKFAFNISPEKA
jgi:hypothetical protein